jgi:LysR family glycine cleavage system transcriptional activator
MLPKRQQGPFEHLGMMPCLPPPGPPNETLEIHSSPTFASHWLARNLGSFPARKWPGIAVRLLQREQDHRFSTATPADISASAGASAPGPEHECHLLGRFSICPDAEPRAGGKAPAGSTEPRHLLKPADHRRPAGTLGKPGLNPVAGLEPPDLSVHTRHNYIEQDLCANAALAGQGVAILNHIYFAEELASGRLIAPFNHHCSAMIVGIWLVLPG